MHSIHKVTAKFVEIVVLSLAQKGNSAKADGNANAFNPSYPAHGSPAARMLALLLLGQKVSPLNAMDALGVISLGPVIIELHNLGWPLKYDIGNTLNRFGELIIFSEYQLRSSAISAAGNKGLAFAVVERLHYFKVSAG